MTRIDGSVPCTSALGVYLRTLRCASGLRQQDVVNRAREQRFGVRPSTKEVWAWEKGLYAPSNRALVFLTEMLGGSPLDTAALIQYDSLHQPVIRAALTAGEMGRARELAQASAEYGATIARQRRLQHARTAQLQPQDEPYATLHAALHTLQANHPSMAELLVRFARFLVAEEVALSHE